MQTHILRSFALVAIGNAALHGKDVSAFWPGAQLLQYDKQIEFMVPRGGDQYTQVAPDPVAWFAALGRLGCTGLRFHMAPMEQKEGIGPQKERMLLGLVGGGPRWLIETVMPARSEVWEGFNRLVDRDDPERRIWLSAYLMLGEIEPQEDADRDIASAAAEVAAALVDIEAFARDLTDAPFAESFAGARATLGGAPSSYPGIDFLALTDLAPDAQRLISAAAEAWVFGAMGSWNDIGVEEHLQSKYEEVSEALFVALQRSLLAVANSSYRC